MHKSGFFAIPLTVFIVAALFTAVAFSDVYIGVKKGDWIEYQVAITGNLENHDAQWAREEVTDVQGPVLNINSTTLLTNDTYLYENSTLNLQTGHLGDDFCIPANLSTGDVFYDVRIGNVTITSSQQKTCVGTQRTVLIGTVVTTNNTETTTFEWDKQTGILVQAFSNYTDYNFTMATVANGTNMWQPQPPVDSTQFYALITGIVIVIVAVAVILVWRKKVKVKS
jgi:hypothetical protein